MHSTRPNSIDKETWEPTITRLFQLDDLAAIGNNSLSTIVEAWSIDCPDHGESAAFNRASLDMEYTRVCQWLLLLKSVTPLIV